MRRPLPLLFAVCAAMALPACGGDDGGGAEGGSGFDVAPIEAELRSVVEGDGDATGVEVSCPDDVEGRAGERFKCEISATLESGEGTGSVDVTLQNPQGTQIEYSGMVRAERSTRSISGTRTVGGGAP